MNNSTAKSGTMVINLVSDYRRRRITLRLPTVMILTVVTMLTLTVIQEPLGWSILAWVSLVPWIVAVVGAAKGKQAAWVSYLVGFIYFLVNLYWLIWVTVAGWLALCFYLGCYFVWCGYILRQVYLKWRWPFTLVVPVMWVGQEYLRSIVLTGFPWFFLGHSQHENIHLIQICDIFGVYGITFLVAMVNGLICDLLLRPLRKGQSKQRKPILSTTTLALLTVLGLIAAGLYGSFRLNQAKKTMTEGPTIAVIQEVIPQYVKQAGESNEEIFVKHLALSREALAAQPRPDLIVWPETMVPRPLNTEFINLPADELTAFGQSWLAESKSYNSRLRDLSGRGVAVLVGAAALEIDTQGNQSRYNSAFLYLPDGRRFPHRYDKMHLVPFGEVVPFKESWPWMYKLLNNLTPYDHEYSLNAGREPRVFEFTDSTGRRRRFSVAICYEDVMPQVPRRLAGLENSKKRIDFLLNISNDGWFVRGGKENKPIKASTELIQHLVICKFRAIENRIGIARAVNTGISGFIRPDGMVQKAAPAGTLPSDLAARQIVPGYLTDKIYRDDRITVYNHIGDTFAILCTVGIILLFAATPLKRKKKG